MRGIQVNLTGKEYGNLVVVGIGSKRGYKQFWNCRCSCGKEVEIRGDDLKNRGDCGCKRGQSWRIDWTGKKCGRLVALRPDGKKRWVCLCRCGKEISVPSNNMRSTKSCGCLQREVASRQGKITGHANRKHGQTGSPEWITWHNIRQRCENPNAVGYDNYGARGIKVCERWQEFANFLADMGPRPSSKHSIDRFPKNQGNYEPGNCRWATAKEQQRNRRDNILIEYNGRTQCLSAWAEEYGLTKAQLWKRHKALWPIHEALTTPVSGSNVQIGYKGKRKKTH
jgi:hypothetical protein